MKTVHFTEHRVWGAHRGHPHPKEYLPMCMVKVQDDQRNASVDLLGIIDSGAQYLMLPKDVAKKLGISLDQCPEDDVIVASGAIEKFLTRSINIEVKGRPARVLAYFGNVVRPLIGLESTYAVMTFGFDQKGWLYK